MWPARRRSWRVCLTLLVTLWCVRIDASDDEEKGWDCRIHGTRAAAVHGHGNPVVVACDPGVAFESRSATSPISAHFRLRYLSRRLLRGASRCLSSGRSLRRLRSVDGFLLAGRPRVGPGSLLDFQFCQVP